MGANIYLQSVWSRTPPLPDFAGGTLMRVTARSVHEAMPDELQRFFDEARASGGYFRNGYNAGDIMWAIGLCWHAVAPMLDEQGYLPIPRARELVEMIEARPLTRERVAAHIFEHMTNGIEPHPTTGPLVQVLQQVVAEAEGVELQPKRPPDLDVLFGFLNKRRDELLTLLRKSIELGEPLYCDL
jgi:hypothetical protein